MIPFKKMLNTNYSSSLITLVFLVVLQVFSADSSVNFQNQDKEFHAALSAETAEDNTGADSGITSEFTHQYHFSGLNTEVFSVENNTYQEVITLLHAIRGPPLEFVHELMTTTQHIREVHYETA